MPSDPSFYPDDDVLLLDSTASGPVKEEAEPEAPEAEEPEGEAEEGTEENEAEAEPAEGEEALAEGEGGEEGVGEEAKEAEEKPAEPELHEITVDGEARQYTLQELKDRAQIAEAAHGRMREAAELKKHAEGLLVHAVKDPLGAAERELRRLGYEDEQIAGYLLKKAEEFLAPHVEELSMPPDQREVARRKRELALRRQRLDEEEAQIKAREEAKRNEALFTQTLTAIDLALDQAGLPKDDDTCVEVGKVLAEAWDAEVEMTPVQAVALVKKHRAQRSEKEQARLRAEQKQRAREAASSTTSGTMRPHPNSGRAPTKPQRRGAVKVGSFEKLLGE